MADEEGNPGTSKGVSVRSETEERIELGVLFKFIKTFDGSREKLNPFIANCQSAYNTATKSQKPILFKFMLSQLTDKAEATCNVKEFESFEQFIEFLKQQFGERKHYAHLLSELQDCRQGSADTVNQFALKIETCLSKLLTEINISIPTKKKAELAGRVAAMQDLALHTFVIGLHPRLSQVVRCRNPSSLNSAISFAVEEEKILSSIHKRWSPHNSNSTDRPKSTPRREFQPQPSRPRLDYSRNVHTNDIICRYCKNVGHAIENCRKRQYNNSRNQLNTQTPNERQNNFTQNPKPNLTRKVLSANQVEDDGVDEVDRNDLNE